MVIYADENIEKGIIEGLRRRGVKVVSVQEEGDAGKDDAFLLHKTKNLGAVVLTHDTDFLSADKHYNDYFSLKDLPILEMSKENYQKAIYYFENADKYCGAIQYGKDFQGLSISHLKEFDVLNFPEMPFKRNCYWEVNYEISNNQLKRIEEEKFLSTIKLYEKPDPALIEKEVLKALSESNKKLDAKNEELGISREKLREYQDMSPSPENVPMSLRVELRLVKIFQEARKVICWLDKHFLRKGLKYLINAGVAGRIGEIKILTAPFNIDDCFKKRFEEFKIGMEDEGTTVDLRVLTKDHLYKNLYARWVITDNSAYKVPPVGSIMKRQIDTINREEDRKRPHGQFSELWEKGIDIITGDWDKIQKKREDCQNRGKS